MDIQSIQHHRLRLRNRSGFGLRSCKRRVSLLTHFVIGLPAILVICSSKFAEAAPSQEDVFKSISDNVDGSVDGRKVLAVLAFIAAIVIIAVIFNRREVRETTPKVLNHQGKLLKELKKSAGLNADQIKHLKGLADQLAVDGEPLESVVTLMLCPSLMKKAKAK